MNVLYFLFFIALSLSAPLNDREETILKLFPGIHNDGNLTRAIIEMEEWTERFNMTEDDLSFACLVNPNSYMFTQREFIDYKVERMFNEAPENSTNEILNDLADYSPKTYAMMMKRKLIFEINSEKIDKEEKEFLISIAGIVVNQFFNNSIDVFDSTYRMSNLYHNLTRQSKISLESTFCFRLSFMHAIRAMINIHWEILIMDLHPPCYSQCAAMIFQRRQPHCQDCKEYADAVINGTQIAWRQRRQRPSRAVPDLQRLNAQESLRVKEEKMNAIAAANEANDLRESLHITYSRKCPICLRKHPAKRVSYLCGHIVCEPCAESQEMQNGKICPFCKSAGSYHRLFEEDGEEVGKKEEN